MPSAYDRKRVPRYIQIIDHIQGKISDGAWGLHHKLPSEDELARQFSFARGTVRQAINELVNSNILYRIHGKGTFVGPQVLQHDVSTARFRSFLKEFIDKGIEFDTELLGNEVIPPPPETNEYLKLEGPASMVLRVRRLRRSGGESIMYSENHIPLGRFPGLETLDFSNTGVYSALESRYHVSFGWSRRYFEAVRADGEVAALLEVERGAPVMLAEQIVYDIDGNCVDCAFIWLRSDKIRISVNMERNDEGS